MADAMPLADNRYKVDLFRALLVDVAGRGRRPQAFGLSMPYRMMPAISPTASSVLLP